MSEGRSNIYTREGLSDEVEQEKKSELSPSTIKAIEEMTHPLTWEESHHFKVDESTITKLLDNQYRMICSKKPLQDYNTYKLKFKVIKMGTMAFGLVPAQSRWGYYVDDRNHNVFKYVAFENGGNGIIKLNKSEYAKSWKFALRKGTEVEFLYDQKKSAVILKTSTMDQIVIPTPSLMGLDLHFYIEMKQ